MKKLLPLIAAVFFLCSCATAPREEPFTVDLQSHNLPVGSGEMYLDKFLGIGSLSRGSFDVRYFPLEDAVSLDFRVRFVQCNQFWSRDGRAAFVAAFERYKEDYEQRNLVRNRPRKTRAAYGEVPGYIAWKKTAISKQLFGGSKAYIGYHIKERAAFFSTTQMEATYEDRVSKRDNQTSAITTMYFTRAQAEALAALFNQELLRGLGRPALPAAEEAELDTDL